MGNIVEFKCKDVSTDEYVSMVGPVTTGFSKVIKDMLPTDLVRHMRWLGISNQIQDNLLLLTRTELFEIGV